MTAQNTPASQASSKRTKSDIARVGLYFTGILGVIAFAATVVFGGIGVAKKSEADAQLSRISYMLDTNPPTSDQNALLFGDPKVTAFRSDPVFRSPEWVAYADLSAPATRDARVRNLNTAKADAEKLPNSDSKDEADTRMTVYKAFIDGGGIDQSREDDQEADAVRLTQKACQAGPGAPAAAYVAAWNLDGSDIRPSALLQPDADKAAADTVIQKAYVAAMTAGIKHLCP